MITYIKDKTEIIDYINQNLDSNYIIVTGDNTRYTRKGIRKKLNIVASSRYVLKTSKM